MCLIWCTPLAWCLSRSKVNKGLPSPPLLATSSSDYPSFGYCAISSSYFPPICSSSCVLFLTYCSLSLFLSLPFLPVCLPISCPPHLPAVSTALCLTSFVFFFLLCSGWFCCLPVFLGALRILAFSPSPLKGAGPTHPILLCSSSPLSGPHCQSMSACLPVCLSCALVCVCVLKWLGSRLRIAPLL